MIILKDIKVILSKFENTKHQINTILKIMKKPNYADSQLEQMILYYLIVFMNRNNGKLTLEDVRYNQKLFNAFANLLKRHRIGEATSDTLKLQDKHILRHASVKFKDTYLLPIVNQMFEHLRRDDFYLEWTDLSTKEIKNDLINDPYIVAKILALIKYIDETVSINNKRILLICNDFHLFPLLFTEAFNVPFDVLVFNNELEIVYNMVLQDFKGDFYIIQKIGSEVKKLPTFDYIFSFLPLSFLPFAIESFFQAIPIFLSGDFIFYQITSSTQMSILDIVFYFFEDYTSINETELNLLLSRFSLKRKHKKNIWHAKF